METKTLMLGGTCSLVATTYGGDVASDVTIDYTEHSSDHYHSDTETSLDVDKEKAVEIIKFLQNSFEI